MSNLEPEITNEPVESVENAEAEVQAQPLARWKKILLIASGVLVAVGLALFPFESGKREELAKTQGAGGGQMLQGQGGGSGTLVLPGDPNAKGDPGAAAVEPELSPALMKMGFSFFAAFAVGLAFRSFLKLAMIVVGLQFLALFGLSYFEWVTVNWETMSGAFDRFVAAVQQESGSFQSFVTGSLPQAGLAGLGLLAGFKK